MAGQRYSLAEAQALLPEARQRVEELADLAGRLRDLHGRLEQADAPADAVDEVATLRSAVDESVAWFDQRGVQIKSLTPALLDFPARAVRDGVPVDVLLCWRDDERTIAFYHPLDGGYRRREPVALLDRV